MLLVSKNRYKRKIFICSLQINAIKNTEENSIVLNTGQMFNSSSPISQPASQQFFMMGHDL